MTESGLVDDDTLEGTERLLRRWFDLLPAERDAMAARARTSFERHFTMNQRRWPSIGYFPPRLPHAENDGADQVSNDADVSNDPPKHEVAKLEGPAGCKFLHLCLLWQRAAKR